MPTCPHCQQPISAKDINCPHCHTSLKAYGHPGIPIHRATGEEPLCLSCQYHTDDSCTYDKRPFARECTLYWNQNRPLVSSTPRPSWTLQLRRHQGWLVLAGIVAIALVITLLQ